MKLRIALILKYLWFKICIFFLEKNLYYLILGLLVHENVDFVTMRY